ncbi:glycosyltransferase family 2 protein [Amycolatopsis sp. CA-128772]|uniref:glycosyltransferase family 2 protein n=1 Tax=Amycolatopsis sp. CA-128772 TaxID=2073159 RepID=UPI0013048D01|nr:glycosyltransferase family 2 protein [Amycolatopsis sp. CA-128772]
MTDQVFPSRWIQRLFPPLDSLDADGVPVGCPVSVVVLAKDEERCIARCLDSVVGVGADRVLVVDTGSVDGTTAIVEQYRRHGVEPVRAPWADSFAEVRNFAIEAVGAGWVVFLDADEWLDRPAAEELVACLQSLTVLRGLDRLVFAPIIRHVGRDHAMEDVPRIFRADSSIRYRGAVHEYPVCSGPVDEPVGMAGLNLVFHHDGYEPTVIAAKDKRNRNIRLLNAAVKDDADNPRWPYFMVRDGLTVLDRAHILDLCETLKELAERNPGTGDRLNARQYYRRALCIACQGLAVMGDWATVRGYADELDRVDKGDSPDAHYFRSVAGLADGGLTGSALLRTVRLRRDEVLIANSAVDGSGRHLDALIAALLERFKSASEAERYREMCAPWTDEIFERSRLRLR